MLNFSEIVPLLRKARTIGANAIRAVLYKHKIAEKDLPALIAKEKAATAIKKAIPVPLSDEMVLSTGKAAVEMARAGAKPADVKAFVLSKGFDDTKIFLDRHTQIKAALGTPKAVSPPSIAPPSISPELIHAQVISKIGKEEPSIAKKIIAETIKPIPETTTILKQAPNLTIKPPKTEIPIITPKTPISPAEVAIPAVQTKNLRVETPTISKELESLAEEARKYKSVKEFIKNSLENLNPTGGIFVEYSPETYAKAPLGKNMTTLDKTIGGSPEDIITVYRGTPGKSIVPGDYITTNKQLARDYTGTGNVIRLRTRKGDVLDDLSEPLGEEYIYRPNAFKEQTFTKSQLTDFYNQATKGIKEIKPIAKEQAKSQAVAGTTLGVKPTKTVVSASIVPEEPIKTFKVPKMPPKKHTTLIGYISTHGGIDPKKMGRDYNNKEVIEHGVMGIFQKDGRGLDEIYSELVDEGLISRVPSNMNPSDHVYEQILKQKGKALEGTKAFEKHITQMENAYYQRLKEEAAHAKTNIRTTKTDTIIREEYSRMEKNIEKEVYSTKAQDNYDEVVNFFDKQKKIAPVVKNIVSAMPETINNYAAVKAYYKDKMIKTPMSQARMESSAKMNIIDPVTKQTIKTGTMEEMGKIYEEITKELGMKSTGWDRIPVIIPQTIITKENFPNAYNLLSKIKGYQNMKEINLSPKKIKQTLITIYSHMYKFKADAKIQNDAIKELETVYGRMTIKKPIGDGLIDIKNALDRGEIAPDEYDVLQAVLKGLKNENITAKIDFSGLDDSYDLSKNLLNVKNISAFTHEVGHYGFFNILTGEERVAFHADMVKKFYGTKESMSAYLAKANTQRVSSNSADSFAEYFAEQFSQYIHTGVLSETQHTTLVQKLIGFIRELYNNLRNKNLLDPDVQKYIEKIVKPVEGLYPDVKKVAQELPRIQVVHRGKDWVVVKGAEELATYQERYRGDEWAKQMATIIAKDEIKALQSSLKSTIEIKAPKLPPTRKKGGLNTFFRSPVTTAVSKEAIAAKYGKKGLRYLVQGHEKSFAIARSWIKKDFARTKERFFDEKVSWTGEKSALGILLAKHYEAKGQIDEVLALIDSWDRQARRAGQGNELGKVLNYMRPTILSRMGNKLFKKITGKDLPPETVKWLNEVMAKIQRMPTETPEEIAAKEKALLEALNLAADKVYEGMPLRNKAKSWLDAYRYQNMLSNPLTTARNVESGIFNLFVTRPLDIIGNATYDILKHPFNPMARDYHMSDAPKYFKQIVTNIPLALIGASQAFKQGYVSSKLMELPRAETQLQAMVQTKIPRQLTFVPRLMEAQDRFFSILIGQGEKSRLLKSGENEINATVKAKNLAEQYLFRERLSIAMKDKTEPLFVRALDGLGHLALEGRKIPEIGAVWDWFVPFITTPTNIAKQIIRYSPLGLIMSPANYSREQLVRAGIGSMITGIGATYALNGDTTWLPPKDAKLRTLWYAAGNKPHSIWITNPATGEKECVSMMYFYPFSVALALPATIKYHQSEVKEALTTSQIEKIGAGILSITNFLTSQTSLTGMNGFIKAMEGDVDYKTGSQMGFVGEQILPVSGLVRYINTIVDPIFRKATTFRETWQKEYPYAVGKLSSKELPAYKTLSDQPAMRMQRDYVSAYPIGNLAINLQEKYRKELLQQQRRFAEKQKAD